MYVVAARQMRAGIVDKQVVAVVVFDAVVVVELVVGVAVDVVAGEEGAEVVGLVVAVRIAGEMAAECYADRQWTTLPLVHQQYP